MKSDRIILIIGIIAVLVLVGLYLGNMTFARGVDFWSG